MPDDGSNFRIGGMGPAELVSLQRGISRAGRAQGSEAKALKTLDGAASSAATSAEIKKAATDFEALLLHEMFQSMWSTVPKDGVLSSSREEELFTDMLHESVAADVAEKQSIGIKEILIRDMERQEKREQHGPKEGHLKS